MYVDATNAWYDVKTSLEVVNLNLWSQLQEAVDIFGLTALDRLFCFVIVRELQVGREREWENNRMCRGLTTYSDHLGQSSQKWQIVSMKYVSTYQIDVVEARGYSFKCQ